MWKDQLAIAYMRQLSLSLLSYLAPVSWAIEHRYSPSTLLLECSLIPIRFLNHSTYSLLAHTFCNEILDIRTTSLLLYLFYSEVTQPTVARNGCQ